MPYVTSIERLAQAEGRQKGQLESKQEDIIVVLSTRFGTPGKRLAKKIRQLDNLRQLRRLFKAIVKAERLKDVRQLLPE